MKYKILVVLPMCAMLFASCQDFLQENPRSVITTGNYYQTQEQIDAAVYGAYSGLDDIYVGAYGVATSPLFAIDYQTGYATRPRDAAFAENQFLFLETLDPANEYINDWWTSAYIPIENCNSVIANLNKTKLLEDAAKNRLLGEMHFLRAHFYFQLVRLFGEVPLKTAPTTNLNEVFFPKSSQDSIYSQIVADLKFAETSGLVWEDLPGRANLGAVKSLLAKVYITMAGYPLQKGTAYYQLAYTKANEVIDSNKYPLFAKYSDLRKATNENTKEHIFQIQRESENFANLLHFCYLPYPEKKVSIQKGVGGAMKPSKSFYDSYEAGDQRVAEKNYYYTSSVQYGKTTVATFDPFIYKYWDADAEVSGKSGANIWCIRSADIMLLAAEAKAYVDGGTTTDTKAINAYYLVRNRAKPNEAKPTSITLDQVQKERYWELCYEFQTWYDMIRTRRAFDVVKGIMVDLIGYTAPEHKRAFIEADLLFPIPLEEQQTNPFLAVDTTTVN